MSASVGDSSPLPAPSKTMNPWLIAVLVVVLACCFCIGVIGLLLAFGEPILHELGLYTWLPFLADFA